MADEKPKNEAKKGSLKSKMLMAGSFLMGIGLALLAIYLYKKYKEKEEANRDLDPDKILSKGSRGKEVTALQILLNAKGNHSPDLAIDGIFGKLTESALFELTGKKSISLKGARMFVKLNAPVAQSATPSKTMMSSQDTPM